MELQESSTAQPAEEAPLALLALAADDDAAGADSATFGQMQNAQCVTLCYGLHMCSCDSAVCAAC